MGMATEALNEYELALQLAQLAAEDRLNDWQALVDVLSVEKRAQMLKASSILLGFQFANNAERQGVTLSAYMDDARAQGRENLGG